MESQWSHLCKDVTDLHCENTSELRQAERWEIGFPFYATSSKNREGSLKQPGHQLHRNSAIGREQNGWAHEVQVGRQDWLSPSSSRSSVSILYPTDSICHNRSLSESPIIFFANPLLVSSTFSLNLNNYHLFSFHKIFKGSGRKSPFFQHTLPSPVVSCPASLSQLLH